MRVVLFTGGRGSGVLSSELIKNDRIALTLAINGYDDGLSTGEVRRFLGDCLGPSDFRKNASRLARKLRTSDEKLIDLLDLRFPDGYATRESSAAFRMLRDGSAPADDFQKQMKGMATGLDRGVVAALGARLDLFETELARTEFPFSFADCSLGNLVFAGCFLHAGRRFNEAVDDYAGLLQLPEGMIENVTDGRNIHLVAIDREGRLLGTEAEIVTADRPQYLRDIYLLDHLPTAEERRTLDQGTAAQLDQFIARHTVIPAANPRLLARLAAADLIVYAPGTQHSSLFPSYITPGIGETIARNLKAVKVLITNIQEDAEISGESAVDLIDKALYYLREKGRVVIPTPCLITHYLLNDPETSETRPYVPLGRLDNIEDPRLVRIGNYEDGVSGTHDASKVLTPFIKSFLRRGERIRLAVLLLDAESLNKVGQTIVEMIRAGIEELPLVLTVYYQCPESFDPAFAASLPFEARNLATRAESSAAGLSQLAQDRTFEYVMLFESSGMYRGDDIVNLAKHLGGERLDAVWGSRRLSVNDIKQAYHLVYRRKPVQAAVSFLGSHVLSLCYLLLYGRYISDTLSGARVIRSSFLRDEGLDYRRRDFNQAVLSTLLRRRAELFETPVYYFPISPEKIRRTSVGDGFRSLMTILRGRLRRLRPAASPSQGDALETRPTPVSGTEAAPLPK
ncbi:MAG: 2-phospho-L-lactate transferase CofD family protein [Gemmatimonadota bacterium]